MTAPHNGRRPPMIDLKEREKIDASCIFQHVESLAPTAAGFFLGEKRQPRQFPPSFLKWGWKEIEELSPGREGGRQLLFPASISSFFPSPSRFTLVSLSLPLLPPLVNGIQAAAHKSDRVEVDPPPSFPSTQSGERRRRRSSPEKSGGGGIRRSFPAPHTLQEGRGGGRRKSLFSRVGREEAFGISG